MAPRKAPPGAVDTAKGYPVAVIARVLDLTSRRVQQLAREGVLPTVGRGRYPLVPCVHAYIKYWRDRAEGRALAQGAARLDVERTRKLAADANLAELELARRRGELLPADEARDELEKIVGGFTAVASGRLQRFERDIVRATTPAAARRLTEQMRAALMEGARDYADTLDAEAAALETEAAA